MMSKIFDDFNGESVIKLIDSRFIQQATTKVTPVRLAFSAVKRNNVCTGEIPNLHQFRIFS